MKGLLIFIFAILTGCSSTQQLADQTYTKKNLSKQLEVGDRISVLRKDGEQFTDFRINSIEQDYLLGKTDQVDPLILPYSTIENLEVYRHSVEKTGVLIISLIVGAAALVFFTLQGL